MGLYSDHILPRGIDWVMGKAPFAEQRARIVPRLSGRVLEVGFGSGLNLPFYGEHVTQLFALDPASLGRKLARRRLEASSLPVEFVELAGNEYRLDSGSVDAVLSTWTMCTIPDLAAALAEIRRVLVPGGELYFLEHGLSRQPGVARWQRRLTPVQRLWAGGCRLDVDHQRALANSGYQIDELEQFVMKPGGALAGSIYMGRARPT